MVFGFFSRKAAPPPQPEAGPSVLSPPSPAADSEAGPSVSPEFRFPPVKQQHTPAPSIDSAAALVNPDTDAQPALKPKKPRAKPKPKPKPVLKDTSPLLPEIPPGPADTPSPGPDDALVTDPGALYSLISSVPAQTLHFYTLAYLNPSPPSALPFGVTAPGPIVPPTPEILTALTTFFAHLAPPPKLHCVRCHHGYFELENGDNACRVAHDDESAIVQRVGTNQHSRALHETLWGCCGQTVDGDGDQGPPDGWCYEGAHTTDVKRARFRADSTMQDDMLTSCEKMRCGMPPRSSASRTSRKRNRRTMEADEDGDDDAESVVSSTRTHTRTHSRSISISSAKGKGKMGPPAGGEEKDEEGKARPVKRPRARKVSISASKKESEAAKEDAMDVDDDDNNVSPPSPPKSPKRGRKPTTTTTTTTSPNSKRKASAPPSPKPKPKTPAKPLSKSSTGTAPIQRSPLSASFVPTSPDLSTIQIRPESPIRKPRGRVEVEIISRTPPRADGVLSKASINSLRSQASMSSLRGGNTRTRTTKALQEIVDTSVDGEGWS